MVDWDIAPSLVDHIQALPIVGIESKDKHLDLEVI